MTTPTFAVKLSVPGQSMSLMGWPTKHAGRPTQASLAAYVKGHEASTCPGGCNAHLGEQRVARAIVRRQSSGDIVATYSAV